MRNAQDSREDASAPYAELIQAALAGALQYELLSKLADGIGQSPPELLNAFAVHIAQRYTDGGISFHDADSAMNAAFGVSCSEEFWAEHDRTIPATMFEVYLAFDAGEYSHPGDGPDVDPEAKYTRPMLKKFFMRSA